jgi:hypothetical protein
MFLQSGALRPVKVVDSKRGHLGNKAQGSCQGNLPSSFDAENSIIDMIKQDLNPGHRVPGVDPRCADELIVKSSRITHRRL